MCGGCIEMNLNALGTELSILPSNFCILYLQFSDIFFCVLKL